MDLLDLAKKHGFIEEDRPGDRNVSLIAGLEKYLQAHPDNENAKLWIKRLTRNKEVQ